MEKLIKKGSYGLDSDDVYGSKRAGLPPEFSTQY